MVASNPKVFKRPQTKGTESTSYHAWSCFASSCLHDYLPYFLYGAGRQYSRQQPTSVLVVTTQNDSQYDSGWLWEQTREIPMLFIVERSGHRCRCQFSLHIDRSSFVRLLRLVCNQGGKHAFSHPIIFCFFLKRFSRSSQGFSTFFVTTDCIAAMS